MNLEGKVPESWACIDCGVNTAPRLLNREQMEQDFAVIRIEQSHGQSVDELSEVYTLKSKIWKAAGILPMGGCLCIGCLERAAWQDADGKGLPA
jgi:hypothetical protein